MIHPTQQLSGSALRRACKTVGGPGGEPDVARPSGPSAYPSASSAASRCRHAAGGRIPPLGAKLTSSVGRNLRMFSRAPIMVYRTMFLGIGIMSARRPKKSGGHRRSVSRAAIALGHFWIESINTVIAYLAKELLSWKLAVTGRYAAAHGGRSKRCGVGVTCAMQTGTRECWSPSCAGDDTPVCWGT
jgi:hypothetical protein